MSKVFYENEEPRSKRDIKSVMYKGYKITFISINDKQFGYRVVSRIPQVFGFKPISINKSKYYAEKETKNFIDERLV